MGQTGIKNHLAELKEQSASTTGVDTDANGQFTFTFDELRRILDGSPANVDAHAAGGYVVNCVSVTGNQATLELRYGGGAGAELDLVTSSTGVTDVYLTATGE